MLTRRSFLKAGSSTLILSSRPLSAQGGAIKRYSIIASKASHRLGRPGTSPTPLWLYNGQSPGPLIEANRGDTLEVAFTNNLEVPTTIHWHGIRNLNEMDGVPDLTQSAVEPGKTFTYSFPLPFFNQTLAIEVFLLPVAYLLSLKSNFNFGDFDDV